MARATIWYWTFSCRFLIGQPSTSSAIRGIHMTQDLVAARKVCLRAIQRVLTKYGLTDPTIAEKLLSALLEDEKWPRHCPSLCNPRGRVQPTLLTFCKPSGDRAMSAHMAAMACGVQPLVCSARETARQGKISQPIMVTAPFSSIRRYPS